MGGYRTLLTTRFVRKARSNKNDLEQRQNFPCSFNPDVQNIRVEKVIILVRLHGRPVLWGSYPEDVLACQKPDNAHGFVCVSLQPLHQVDFPRILRNSRVPNKGIDDGTGSDSDRLGGLSVEVYASSTAFKGPVEGQAKELRTWSGNFVPFTVWAR